MIQTPPSVADLPTTPDRNNRATFSNLIKPFLDALTPLKNQLTALAANVFGNATEAYNAAAAAAASAAAAINAPGTSATSTTSLVIGTGSKTLTIQTGKAFAVGQFVVVANTSAPGNYFAGQVTAHNSGTGSIAVNATGVGGAGTFADWTMALGAPPPSGGATLTGSETLTNKTVQAAVFTDGYTEEVATANTGTAYTIDLANGSIQLLTLTGNCTFTFPAATAGKSFVLLLKQDATGSRTVTWPATAKWPASAAPTITAAATKLDRFVFTADGTNWLGAVAGQNYL